MSRLCNHSCHHPFILIRTSLSSTFSSRSTQKADQKRSEIYSVSYNDKKCSSPLIYTLMSVFTERLISLPQHSFRKHIHSHINTCIHTHSFVRSKSVNHNQLQNEHHHFSTNLRAKEWITRIASIHVCASFKIWLNLGSLLFRGIGGRCSLLVKRFINETKRITSPRLCLII